MGKIKESRLAALRQTRTQSILPGLTYFPLNKNGMRANKETFASYLAEKKLPKINKNHVMNEKEWYANVLKRDPHY